MRHNKTARVEVKRLTYNSHARGRRFKSYTAHHVGDANAEGLLAFRITFDPISDPITYNGGTYCSDGVVTHKSDEPQTTISFVASFIREISSIELTGLCLDKKLGGGHLTQDGIRQEEPLLFLQLPPPLQACSARDHLVVRSRSPVARTCRR